MQKLSCLLNHKPRQKASTLAEVAAAREVALDDRRSETSAKQLAAFEEELDARLAEQQASHDAELDRFTAKLEKKMTKVAREFAAKDAEIARLRSARERLQALSPVPTNVSKGTT